MRQSASRDLHKVFTQSPCCRNSAYRSQNRTPRYSRRFSRAPSSARDANPLALAVPLNGTTPVRRDEMPR